MVSEVARILDGNKAENIAILDLAKVNNYLDFFVIATALSPVHLKKLANDVLAHFKKSGIQAQRPNEEDVASGWVILDFRDFVVHLFLADVRAYYQLETLWQNATQMEWQSNETG